LRERHQKLPCHVITCNDSPLGILVVVESQTYVISVTHLTLNWRLSIGLRCMESPRCSGCICKRWSCYCGV